ncbi:hypothetical protein JL722_12991 [Aureococcus anophagefferens]|nr:hypothetical protein JL722_12991 [Aureococcus anophagefferens]
MAGLPPADRPTLDRTVLDDDIAEFERNNDLADFERDAAMDSLTDFSKTATFASGFAAAAAGDDDDDDDDLYAFDDDDDVGGLLRETERAFEPRAGGPYEPRPDITMTTCSRRRPARTTSTSSRTRPTPTTAATTHPAT